MGLVFSALICPALRTGVQPDKLAAMGDTDLPLLPRYSRQAEGLPGSGLPFLRTLSTRLF